MSESTLEGTRLGAYRIEKQLGEGAMGDVFLAVQDKIERHVALKKLKPAVAANPQMMERFFAEARAVNIIRHENIVECTDLVNDGANSYIVMELLEGKTLSAAIRQAKQMPPIRAAKIAAQIADALAAAHAKGIVHRDLKPDNVFLIKRAGSADYVKVLDFGMARLRPEMGVGATQSGALIGTPAYMSPEQAKGEKVGPEADVYALGVVLFHMLSGQLPFSAESLTMMLIQIVQETPPRIDKFAKDIPAPLVALVARCLEKDADKRPADMATLRRELLESVGLPVETLQSVASAQSSLGSGGPSSVALSETLDSGAKVSALAETSAPGLGATTAPVWSGQSSLTAAAAEISQATKPRPKWPLIAAGGGVLAVAVVIGLVVVGGDKHAASPSSAPAASAPTAPSDRPPVVPIETVPPTAAQTPAPAPAPTPAPPVPDTGSAVEAVATAGAGSAAKKSTTKKTTGKTTTAQAGTGSAAPAAGSAAPPVETKPPPEEKIDRTKQLVGPKPPGT